jgi:hypothetical protein
MSSHRLLGLVPSHASEGRISFSRPKAYLSGARHYRPCDFRAFYKLTALENHLMRPFAAPQAEARAQI